MSANDEGSGMAIVARRAVAGITELISPNKALKTVPKTVLPAKPLDDGDGDNQ